MFVVLDVGELTSSGAGDPTSSQQRICSLSSLFISWFSSVRMEKGNWSTSEVNGMADAFAYRSVIIPINLPLISKHHPRGDRERATRGSQLHLTHGSWRKRLVNKYEVSCSC